MAPVWAASRARLAKRTGSRDPPSNSGPRFIFSKFSRQNCGQAENPPTPPKPAQNPKSSHFFFENQPKNPPRIGHKSHKVALECSFSSIKCSAPNFFWILKKKFKTFWSQSFESFPPPPVRRACYLEGWAKKIGRGRLLGSRSSKKSLEACRQRPPEKSTPRVGTRFLWCSTWPRRNFSENAPRERPYRGAHKWGRFRRKEAGRDRKWVFGLGSAKPGREFSKNFPTTFDREVEKIDRKPKYRPDRKQTGFWAEISKNHTSDQK